MSSVEVQSAASTETPQSPATPNDESREARNLIVLAAQQVLLRLGWIFKTETVIIPAFLDVIAGAGWIRGCLPVLNRIGQSIPPLLFASRLRRAQYKKTPLLLTGLLMAVPFLTLAGLLLIPGSVGSTWLPVAFLGLYGLFFAMTGLNQLCFGTIQGKLIAAHHRGRLLAIGGVGGSIAGVTAAWFLLQKWLSRPDGFSLVFAFTGFGFACSGLVTMLVAESPDQSRNSERAFTPFRDAWRRVRDERELRRLVIVAMLFVTTLLLVPHYQALGRQQTQATFSDMMIWVVVQNVAAATLSLLAGIVADRRGNRLAVRGLMFGAGLTPIVALALAYLADPKWFWLTYIALGTVPTTFRTIANYALELTGSHRHAQYLSTVKLFMAVPLIFSPLVGLLLDVIGFVPVFTTIAALTSAGAVMTFYIIEPRHAENPT